MFLTEKLLLAILHREFVDCEFSCERVMGLRAPGWIVRSQGKGAFVSERLPDSTAVRGQIEKAFGLHKKRERSQEEVIVGRSRTLAGVRRAFRNRISKGEKFTPPWARPRTLSVIIAEERTLAIAAKLSRMGEMRR